MPSSLGLTLLCLLLCPSGGAEPITVHREHGREVGEPPTVGSRGGSRATRSVASFLISTVASDRSAYFRAHGCLFDLRATSVGADRGDWLAADVVHEPRQVGATMRKRPIGATTSSHSAARLRTSKQARQGLGPLPAISGRAWTPPPSRSGSSAGCHRGLMALSVYAARAAAVLQRY